MPIDSDGNIPRTATPLTLDQHTDLCPLFKIRAMNCAIAHLNRPSRGQISFQPALVYDFHIDASCVQMPTNWQADQIMDTDEIATIPFPSIKAGNRLTSTGTASGMPTVTMNELMLRLLDTEVLLVSMIDPKSSFPPNARQIALQADSLKRSITDGMYAVEDAELIVQAAAELTSANEMHNRLTRSTYEDDHGSWLNMMTTTRFNHKMIKT